ncbi:hypothetical protein M885DRAFT_567011 [Pelagophyceae sp. CCMP2097]|nr:hypothetical protein M885DRAFT_567011 [Pelagophyceae sp. CCMP2097]
MRPKAGAASAGAAAAAGGAVNGGAAPGRAAPMHMPSLRVFLPNPRTAATWVGDYEEKRAHWSELFLDLIMVASVSNVTAALRRGLEGGGGAWAVWKFLLMFQTEVSGWAYYTLWTARYSDDSLVGSVNSYLMPYAHIPTSRKHIRSSARHELIAICVLSMAVCHSDDERFALKVLAVITLIEVPIAHVRNAAVGNSVRRTLGEGVIPMNVEHFTERMGALVLVVLGESVLSSVINLGRVREASGEIRPVTEALLANVSLVLLVTFSFSMFYFAMSPPRALHALRRSFPHGIGFFQAHLVLFHALALLGTGIKSATGDILAETILHRPRLLFLPLAVANAAVFTIRLLHFGGRHPHRPARVPRARDITTVRYVWWVCAAASPLLPLAGLVTLRAFMPSGLRPIPALLVLALAIVFYVVLEHAISAELHRLILGGVASGIPTSPHTAHHPAEETKEPYDTERPPSEEQTPLKLSPTAAYA